MMIYLSVIILLHSLHLQVDAQSSAGLLNEPATFNIRCTLHCNNGQKFLANKKVNFVHFPYGAGETSDVNVTILNGGKFSIDLPIYKSKPGQHDIKFNILHWTDEHGIYSEDRSQTVILTLKTQQDHDFGNVILRPPRRPPIEDY